MSTKQKIIQAAGARGKTKRELAERLGLSYSHTAKLVNELLFESKLVFERVTSSGAEVFAKVPEGARVLVHAGLAGGKT